jgi:ASC-1-like (ASCH) protein
MSNKNIPKDLQPWIDAKKRHRLSQKHIQMARELGMNPKSFGKLDNHKQEQWKAPLPQFIEDLYFKRFKKENPDVILSFEQISKLKNQKKIVAKEQKSTQIAGKASLTVGNEASSDLNHSKSKDLETASDKQSVFQLICEEPWFSLIRQGIKPVEGRKNSPKHQKIKINDLIDFSNGKEHFRTIVTEIRSYTSLKDYLNNVTIQKALPYVSSFEEALKIYHQWSTPDEIETHGFLGIFIKPISHLF